MGVFKEEDRINKKIGQLKIDSIDICNDILKIDLLKYVLDATN